MQLVATVPLTFQRFPITPGNTTRHERDMDAVAAIGTPLATGSGGRLTRPFIALSLSSADICSPILGRLSNTLLSFPLHPTKAIAEFKAVARLGATATVHSYIVTNHAQLWRNITNTAGVCIQRLRLLLPFFVTSNTVFLGRVPNLRIDRVTQPLDCVNEQETAESNWATA